jgi:hypothetical protein
MTLIGSTAAASAEPFTVSADHQLKITWEGRPLVSGDELTGVADAFTAPQGSRVDQIDGRTVHNLWRIGDVEKEITYRREVADNGREVELTVQSRVPAYYENWPEGGSIYRFNVPLKALEGMTFHALAGRGSRLRELSGKITADMTDGPIMHGDFPFGDRPTFVAFEKEGRGLIFDFNPKGPAAWNDYGPTALDGHWRIDKKGDQLNFYFGATPKLYGGVYSSKIRIVEGTFADYGHWHAHRHYSYYGEFPAIKQISLKSGAPLKGWTAATKKDQSPFAIDVPEPGIYIFTLSTTAQKPFNITCDGQTMAQDVSAEAGKVKTIVFSRYSDDRQIQLNWTGEQSVDSIIVQALIYAPEDFAFKRGVWLAENVPTPSDLFMFKRDFNGKAAPASIQAAAWGGKAPSTQAVEQVKLPPGDTAVPDQNDPGRAWRWDGNITGMGPSNNGSFYEFETDEQINRRLDELQKMGYRTLLLNGLLARHLWVDQLPRVKKTMAHIVRLAHQRGMKVLDHQDLTIVAYADSGYNVLLKHLDWTQRDVRTGQMTRGWCLNNPHFQEHYWKYITDWVRDTGIDGIMIDEATFHGEMYCGCEYCREKFHHDTGLDLPFAPSSVLMNKQDRLWKLWLSWRIKSVGDWWVDLARRVQSVRPDFVLMKYTTNGGMQSSAASLGFGASLPESARAVDFLGTEIMSRNVYASFRANLAYRELFNSLHHAFGSPIFGLVYPVGQPVYAYAGWAMNNMRGQVTWAMTGDAAIEADAKRYIGWKENMDLRHAKPVADVAVLFSLSSRDFPKYYGHADDLIGACEQLDDQHVPYEILLDRNLTAKMLASFRLLILPSDCSMSDAQVAVVKSYLEGGGRVLSMGHTAVLDELGFDRKTWLIGQWIGLRFTGKMVKAPVQLSGSAVGQKSVSFPQAVIQVLADSSASIQAKVLATVDTKGHKSVAIAQGKVGKGTLTVVAPRLGAANYEPESTVDRVWGYQYDPAPAQLFAHLIDAQRGDHPPFKAIQIPPAVRVSVYEQPDGKGKTMTLVHLYNGTGVDMKKGERVSGQQPKEAFPPLDDDLTFEITLNQDGPVRGELVSPDFSSSRAVQVKEIGEHRYQVRVGKADLQAYAIVRLGNP